MQNNKLLDSLITSVVERGASDLHLSDGRYPILRADGFLVPLSDSKVLSDEDIREMLESILDEDRLKYFYDNQEIDFAYTHTLSGSSSDEERAPRFRCNAYFHQRKVAIAMRLIPDKIPSLSELNLPKTLEQFANRRQGFFMVVGPTGHGKSTTLASIIDIINSNRLENIITIEDPIEYAHKSKKSIINQREVGEDTVDFHTGLTSVFRQDGDVIMIGEMRSPETMAAAVTAAETGHLVLSTLHTNTAAQTVQRIIDSFPSEQQQQVRLQLAGSLAGIFSQRLVPRVSGGLVPAYELLISNAAVSNLIRENRTHELDTVIETSSDQGMIDMNRTLADLVHRGEITVDNALAYSVRPQTLEKLL